MANAPYTPPPLDYESVPETGVRRLHDADAWRSRHWSRWGAVLGGVFTALGIGILLSTLGVALGFTAFDPRGGNNPADFGRGAAIWFAVQSIICVFIGSLVASRLAGTLRRSDGALNGLVTWGTMAVATLALFGSLASTAVTGAANAADAASRRDLRGAAQQFQQQLQPGRVEQAREGAMGTAWGAFGLTAITLLAGLAGGAAGALGRRRVRSEGVVRRETYVAPPEVVRDTRDIRDIRDEERRRVG